MQNNNKSWIFISLSGTLSVLMGAMAAHMLKNVLSVENIERIKTAADYQLAHTLMIAILTIYSDKSKSLKLSIILFGLAVIFFSGNLYLFAFTEIVLFSYLTPIGGVLFVAAWLSLILLAFKKQN